MYSVHCEDDIVFSDFLQLSDILYTEGNISETRGSYISVGGGYKTFRDIVSNESTIREGFGKVKNNFAASTTNVDQFASTLEFVVQLRQTGENDAVQHGSNSQVSFFSHQVVEPGKRFFSQSATVLETL